MPCLSIGKLTAHYSLIILFIMSMILFDSFYGFNVNNTFTEVKIYENYISKHDLFPYIFNYFGIALISSILYYQFEKNNFSNKDSKSKSNKETQKGILSVKLIHNDSKLLYGNHYLGLICIGILFLWNLEEQLLLVFRKLFKDLDFWMVELLIISKIYSKMFNINIYKHQNLAIYLNLTVPLVLKIISIIMSFSNKEGLYEGKLPILYSNSAPALIGIIIYIPLISLRSYVNSKLKWLIDLKYISSNKLLMLHGLIGCIYCSINFIIVNFWECGTFNFNYDIETNGRDQIIIKTYNFNLSDYVCRYRINDPKNPNETEYFDKFEIHENVQWWSEIITIIFGILTFFVIKYSYISIIKYLSPIHLIFSIPIYYIYGKIVMIIHNLYIEKKPFSYEENNIKLTKFYLDIAGDITAAIGFLIYLEIVILNFNGYNYNIKSNIIIRSHDDSSLKEERESLDLEYNLDDEK